MLQPSLSAVRRQRSSNLAPNAPSSPGVSLEEPPGDFPPCWQPGFALALLGAARSLTETSQCLVPGRKSAVPVQRRSSTHAAAPLSSTHRSCSTVRIFVSVWSSSCHFFCSRPPQDVRDAALGCCCSMGMHRERAPDTRAHLVLQPQSSRESWDKTRGRLIPNRHKIPQIQKLQES